MCARLFHWQNFSTCIWAGCLVSSLDKIGRFAINRTRWQQGKKPTRRHTKQPHYCKQCLEKEQHSVLVPQEVPGENGALENQAMQRNQLQLNILQTWAIEWLLKHASRLLIHLPATSRSRNLSHPVLDINQS